MKKIILFKVVARKKPYYLLIKISLTTCFSIIYTYTKGVKKAQNPSFLDLARVSRKIKFQFFNQINSIVDW